MSGQGPCIGRVDQLWRYPVSSLAGQRQSRATVTEQGVSGDRLGAFHERESGAVVFPGIVRKWNLAPRMAARTSVSGQVEVSLDGVIWRPLDDPALDSALTGFCGTPVVFRPYGSGTDAEPVVQRYDFSPVHLISRQALDALQALLPGSCIDARRFRPNIVVDLPGLDGRCPEYRLVGNRFTIGTVPLRGLRASGRCSFTTLAQRDLPEDRDVLRALIQHFDKDFGIYCEVIAPGTISEGDEIALTEPVRPIVILGAGQAGAQVAHHLRELGCTQPIRVIGDEPYPPYERPPLSKVDGDTRSPVIPASRYREAGIELRVSTRIDAIDTQRRVLVDTDGTSHPYDRLVIATGGEARTLKTIPLHPRVHRLRTADDARDLRARLTPGATIAIIGAGWLGLELAATARRRGCAVTVFGRSDRVLNRSVPRVVSRFIETRHRAEGVDLRLDTSPIVRVHDDAVDVGTERFDALVLAIGMTPNDRLAQEAGLETDDGILVDGRGVTSDPAILAAGDVAQPRGQGGRVESWHAANDQARAVARRLMFLPAEPPPPPRFWSTQYDMTLQIVGRPDPDAHPEAHSDGIAPFWDFGSFVVGINRPREIRKAMARLDKRGTPASAPVRVPVVTDGPARRHVLGPRSAFSGGGPYRLEIPDLGPIVLVYAGGAFRAADDRCPHAEASLSEGFVEDGRIVCPVHFAEFDLTRGTPINAPPGCDHLRCYRVENAGDTLVLLLEQS